MKYSSTDLINKIRNAIRSFFTIARRDLLSDILSKFGLGLGLGLLFKYDKGINLYLVLIAFSAIIFSVLIAKDKEDK